MIAHDDANPVEVFLDVQHKLESDEEYTVTEKNIDFMRLFHALQSSIRASEGQLAQIKSAEEHITELGIDLFNRDIELFNISTQLDPKEAN